MNEAAPKKLGYFTAENEDDLSPSATKPQKREEKPLKTSFVASWLRGAMKFYSGQEFSLLAEALCEFRPGGAAPFVRVAAFDPAVRLAGAVWGARKVAPDQAGLEDGKRLE